MPKMTSKEKKAIQDRPLSKKKSSIPGSKTLTKAEIAQAFAEIGMRSKMDCTVIIEKLLAIMKKAIKNDKRLLISSFGCFESYAKNVRRGRNPATGESLILPGRNVVVFRISRSFRRELNQQND